MPSLDRADAWVNSKPLSAADLRGKVVLVQFWTYSCINWMRTLPYVRAWSEKYRDQGLVVIGVHTPEFSFEKRVDNVQKAAKDLNVGFPVAVDSDYEIWKSFGNRYWPALYITDAQGRIRHHHFGEGGYETRETVIQELLMEAGRNLADRKPVSVKGQGVEADADWKSLGSPETYIGYARAEKFTSPGGFSFDKRLTYTVPERLRINQWALAGDWTVKEESAKPECRWRPDLLSFPRARRSSRHVAGAAGSRRPVPRPSRRQAARFRPRTGHRRARKRDGRRAPHVPAHSAGVTDRGPTEFEIEFLDPGVEVFVFTFG